MKLKLASILFISAIFMLIVAGCSSDTSSSSDGDDVIKLVYATSAPPNHGWSVGFSEPWIEKIEEKTNGKVQFETYYSGELTEMGKEYDAISQDVADIVGFPPIYDPSRFPMSEVTLLPLLHSDVHIASRAYKRLLESDVELQDGKSFSELEYASMGLKLLPLSTTAEYTISTTGKEFNSVKDLTSSMLRTSSRVHEMYANNIDVGTITMPASDMYDAMSRGAFDGAVFSIPDWPSYGFQELFKYSISGLNFGHFNSAMAMKQETWESLPEDVQEVFIEVTNEVIEPSADLWMQRQKEMEEYSLENDGKFVEFSDLDPELQEHLISGLEKTWFDYIDLLEEQGLPGKELVKLWRDLIVEEGGKVPEGVMNIE